MKDGDVNAQRETSQEAPRFEDPYTRGLETAVCSSLLR